MPEERWITEALFDDTLPAELLLRMKFSSPSDYMASMRLKLLVLPPVAWGHRRRRSKAMNGAKREGETTTATRCSPTTPLSWSGGTSAASPSDGCDESSRPSSRSFGSRSKDTVTNGPAITTSSSESKRLKRKKTFAELKEEESLLLKENIHLTSELESVHVTLKDQKSRSETLKRIKLDLNLETVNQIVGGASDKQEEEAAVALFSKNHFETKKTEVVDEDVMVSSSSCCCNIETKNVERCFVLPDLNMMPSEDD